MASILKILALLSSIVTSVFLSFESMRLGLTKLSPIVGVLEILVFLTFTGLLVFILYLILSKKRYPVDDVG